MVRKTVESLLTMRPEVVRGETLRPHPEEPAEGGRLEGSPRQGIPPCPENAHMAGTSPAMTIASE